MRDLSFELFRAEAETPFRLNRENALKNSVMISLFSHPKWWGESVDGNPKFECAIGKNPQTLTDDYLDSLEEQAYQALAWMIEEEIVSEIEVKPTILRTGTLGLNLKFLGNESLRAMEVVL